MALLVVTITILVVLWLGPRTYPRQHVPEA